MAQLTFIIIIIIITISVIRRTNTRCDLRLNTSSFCFSDHLITRLWPKDSASSATHHL